MNLTFYSRLQGILIVKVYWKQSVSQLHDVYSPYCAYYLIIYTLQKDTDKGKVLAWL